MWQWVFSLGGDDQQPAAQEPCKAELKKAFGDRPEPWFRTAATMKHPAGMVPAIPTTSQRQVVTLMAQHLVLIRFYARL